MKIDLSKISKYGVVDIINRGFIQGIVEKPSFEEALQISRLLGDMFLNQKYLKF